MRGNHNVAGSFQKSQTAVVQELEISTKNAASWDFGFLWACPTCMHWVLPMGVDLVHFIQFISWKLDLFRRLRNLFGRLRNLFRCLRSPQKWLILGIFDFSGTVPLVNTAFCPWRWIWFISPNLAPGNMAALPVCVACFLDGFVLPSPVNGHWHAS